MTYTELLGRRSEILKRNIGKMIVQDNQTGLGGQESLFLQRMIRELHQTEHELQASRSN
ncbi:hypothetical protein ACFO9Q_03335 [Paenibacillus sp. GCM10023252]|uniref:hypothetical protein n=1 Tax=Paenibacillus sp. GCM10023252 TaxID=3252649 RepID=UPI00360B0F0A